MDIDDTPNPNKPYLKLMSAVSLDLAMEDDDTLDYLLFALAAAVPNRTVAVEINTISALRMNDLRDSLKSGNYDQVAREVLRRCIAAKEKPAPSLLDTETVGGSSAPGIDANACCLLEAVRNAFTNPYRGSSTTLQKAIEQVIGDRGLYANAIPFVQSSGTGKSRLMVELGQHFFVLILNLREDDPAGSFSFPPPDRDVRVYLQEMERATTDSITLYVYWRLRYAAFLCAVFDVLSTIIEAGASLPSKFAEHIVAHRGILLKNIVNSSRSIEAKFFKLYSERADPSQTCGQITRDNLLRSAEDFFKVTRRLSGTLPPDHPPPLVLALDEAHMMTKCEASVPVPLLDIFCGVMADLKEVHSDWNKEIHFACMFLSTNIKLRNVAPSTVQISSQRTPSLRLAGAFTCIPFDVFVDGPKRRTVQEISTLYFLSRFGRPLFGALIYAGLDVSSALDFAQEKLAHAKRPFTADALMKDQTAFALLSRRILLHFRPLQSSTATMASNLVARHLQVAYVVPTHRRFLVSGSPSEPFLVEAAAHMMATPGFTTIDCLLRFTNEELLDPGESGEIIGRSLTIDAYDAALRTRPAPLYHSWVYVLDFLKAFLTDEVYARVAQMKPFRDPNGSTLETAFANAVVRLTHYVHLSHLTLIEAANVRKAFLRGMGIVGAQSQKLFDILIPMLFVDRRKPPSEWVVEEKMMSQIMANWKNKAADATPPHSDPYDDYPKLNTTLPTILMWHQFGSEKNKVDLPQAEQVHHPGRAVYLIDLYGIKPQVYRGITEANAAKYQQVVGCADIYRDAPYTYPEYIADVERTLPRWSAESFEQTAG